MVTCMNAQIKTALAIIGVLVIVFSIVGIVSALQEPLQAGIVTAKNHYEEYEQDHMFMGRFYSRETVPERYVICVASGKTVEEWDVSKELFERIKLGDFITRQQAGKK